MALATLTRLDRAFAVAKQLTPQQREKLVGLIVSSLPGFKRKSLTMTILDRCLEELTSGSVKGTPVAEFTARLRRVVATGRR